MESVKWKIQADVLMHNLDLNENVGGKAAPGLTAILEVSPPLCNQMYLSFCPDPVVDNRVTLGK